MVDVIFRDVDPMTLAEIARLLGRKQPEILEEPAEWTAESAERLLRDLRPAAFGLLSELVRHGGRVDAGVFRGEDGEQSLRGLTGPLTKAMRRLTQSGRIPAGLPHPVEAEYDPEIRAYQRTKAFVMAEGVLPHFTAALRKVEDSP